MAAYMAVPLVVFGIEDSPSMPFLVPTKPAGGLGAQGAPHRAARLARRGAARTRGWGPGQTKWHWHSLSKQARGGSWSLIEKGS